MHVSIPVPGIEDVNTTTFDSDRVVISPTGPDMDRVHVALRRAELEERYLNQPDIGDE